MGQTLGTAAQWTSATKEGIGKLELTAANEVILNKIVAFIDGFPSRHGAEARVTFKQPLVWTSELSAADFNAGYTQKYHVTRYRLLIHIQRTMRSLERIVALLPLCSSVCLSVWADVYSDYAIRS